MNDLVVSIVQDDIAWQDPAANRARIDRHLASLDGTDLVVLPEFFSTGFYTDPSEKYETMGGRTAAWMSRRAADMGAVITGSVVMRLEGKPDTYVNRMLWARPDGSMDWYDKRHLFRFGGEHHHYTGGDRRVVFLHKGWPIAPFVCYDVRFPVWSRNRGDYDVAIYVANWPESRQYAWDTLVRARAIENQSYVLAVNRLGTNPNGDRYRGGSAILDYLGKPVADCAADLRVATAALSRRELDEYREFFPARMDQDAFTIDLN